MKYPRLPEELDRRKKVHKKDIKEMRHLRFEEGWKIKDIAEKFGINPSSVYYNISEKRRNKQLELNRRNLRERLKTDSEYKERVREYVKGSHAYRMKVYPKYRKYVESLNKKK